MEKQVKPKKKKSGPKPKLTTLHPFTFDEVLNTLLTQKPKKGSDKNSDGSNNVKEEIEEK